LSFETAEVFPNELKNKRPADARFSFWAEAPGEWAAEPVWFHRALLPDGRAWPAFGRTRGGYLLHFEGQAAFGFTRDGREIDAICAPGAEQETVKRLFLDQVIPLVLTLWGRECLHASAVGIDRRQALFVGASGAGKSTLAAALAGRGAALLSDDCVALAETGRRMVFHPGQAASRLWRDSAAALSLDARAGARPAPGHGDKLLVAMPDGGAAALELDALYLISSSSSARSIEIAPAPAHRAVPMLLEAAFRLDLDDEARLARQFEFLMRLAARLPVFELRYPREFGRLDATCEAVSRSLRALPR
jgi:hypothetical protein